MAGRPKRRQNNVNRDLRKKIPVKDKWKLFAGYAAPGTGNKDTYPHRIISTPFVAEPGTISSETYLCIGPFDSKNQAESVLSYLSCRLTRLLILLHKPTQGLLLRADPGVDKAVDGQGPLRGIWHLR
jgi:hypothetical protein